MIKKLKQFKAEKSAEILFCEMCEKKVKSLGSIRICTISPTHVYKNSKRHFIMNYKMRFCESCHEKAVKHILN